MQVSTQFKNDVSSWVQVDNTIRQHNEDIKKIRAQINEINKKKGHIEKNIITYMSHNGLTENALNLPDGSLKYSVSKKSECVSKEYIEKRLAKYFNNSTKAKEVMDFIYDKEARDITEKPVLKRTVRKK